MFINEDFKKTQLGNQEPVDNDSNPVPAADAVPQEPVITPDPETGVPPAEPPVTEPQPSSDDPVPPAEPPAEPAPGAEPQAQPTFEQLLEQRSGGRFKSLDDALAELERLENANKVVQPGEEVFADETNRLLNHYVKSGKGSLAEGYSLLTKDFSAMDQFSVLKEYSELREPFLTPEEREAFIQEWKERLDPDQYSEKDIQRSSVELKRMVEAQRQELIRDKEATINGIREEMMQAQPPAVQNGPTPEQVQQAVQAWQSEVDTQLLPSVRELEFTAADGSKVKYVVDDAARGAAKNDIYNIDSFSERYKNADGTYDKARAAADLVKLNNFDKILQAVYTQAKAGGVAGNITEIVNAPVPVPATPPAQQNPNGNVIKDPLTQAAAAILGRR